MNDDISIMMKIYNTFDIDWMGDVIGSLSDLTRHHIVKKEKGGIDDISNYALLTRKSHELLHYLEDNYYSEYVKLNYLFLMLNRTNKTPTSDYFETIKSIMKKVRKGIKNKRRGRK